MMGHNSRPTGRMYTTRSLLCLAGKVVGCWFIAIGTPFAQDRSDTAIVSVNAGLQPNTHLLSERISLQKNVETAPVTVTLGNKGVPMVDLGGTVRIINSLGVNAAFSSLSDTGAAAISAEIPHPFYFNQLRPISGEATVVHDERAFHIDAAYVIPSETILLVLFGGPSFFSVKKDFVTDVAVNETYPYDTATFASATVTQLSANVTGFNVGADVTWRLGRQWGVGGILRYSRGEVVFRSQALDFGTITVGGLQAGGGLRLLF